MPDTLTSDPASSSEELRALFLSGDANKVAVVDWKVYNLMRACRGCAQCCRSRRLDFHNLLRACRSCANAAALADGLHDPEPETFAPTSEDGGLLW